MKFLYGPDHFNKTTVETKKKKEEKKKNWMKITWRML
jgi:hypothetical protein